MAKSSGSTIDASRDPRRQPQRKPSQPPAEAESIKINSKAIKASPNPASKSSAKTMTVIPSSRERSNKESETEVSSENALPSTPQRSKVGFQSTKISIPSIDHLSSTTVPSSVEQTNAAHPSTTEHGRVRLTGRALAETPIPSPLRIGSSGTSMLSEASSVATDTVAVTNIVPNQNTSTQSKASISASKTRQNLPHGSPPSLKQRQTRVQSASTGMLLDTKIDHKKKAEAKELKKNITKKKLSPDDYTVQQPVQKPNPHYTDTSERLRRDSEIETQYIKGIGEVIIRHGPEINSDAKPTTPRVLDNESFPVKSYLTRLRSVPTQYMRWISEIDGFEIILNASETISIPAKAISSISYNYECRKFYLSSNEPTTSAGHLEESVLEIGGDQQAPSKLRSLFERRFSGFKVHKVETGFFATKEHMFQRLNIGSLPLRSTPRPDGFNSTLFDGLEEGVIEDLKTLNDVAIVRQKASQVPGILQQSFESSPTDTIRVQTSSEIKIQVGQDSSPEDEEGQLSLPVSEAHLETPGHIMRRKRKLTEPAVSGVTPFEGTSRQWLKKIVVDKSEDPNTDPGSRSRARSTSEAFAHQFPATSSSPPSQATEADPSQMFLYNSKERVRRNDLVIRIRDPDTVEGGYNKHDRLDVYDGPFRISRLPKPSGLLDSEKNVEQTIIGSQTLAPPSGTRDFERMKEALVKLHFPSNSRAKALTKLGRLRPVYKVPQDIPAEDCDARSCYNLAKTEEHASGILNTLVLDKESGDDESNIEIRGVCRIQKGAYVKVDYIAPEGLLEDNVFEVEKLRGKRVDRHPLKEFPDEKMDDPTVLRYLEDGGQLGESQVLVVKYLVHWAGWPSEDGTWERAQDNIPQEFIDDYNAIMDDHDVVIANPPNKRRKSEAKQFVKGS
ncbi:hypothetical protein MMC18_007777 [Xylographa bjoerkii]|nr:hypothetical protein [Xylographa bjoerkii]